MQAVIIIADRLSSLVQAKSTGEPQEELLLTTSNPDAHTFYEVFLASAVA